MKYRKTGRYIYRNIAGEGVLVPVRDGICNLENMLLLNETSTAIWELIRDNETVDEETLINRITEAYEVEKNTAQADLKELINDFVEARCIECI